MWKPEWEKVGIWNRIVSLTKAHIWSFYWPRFQSWIDGLLSPLFKCDSLCGASPRYKLYYNHSRHLVQEESRWAFRFLAHLVTNGPTRHCRQGGVQLLLVELFLMKNYSILKNFHLLASGFIHNLNRCVCVCVSEFKEPKEISVLSRCCAWQVKLGHNAPEHARFGGGWNKTLYGA